MYQQTGMLKITYSYSCRDGGIPCSRILLWWQRNLDRFSVRNSSHVIINNLSISDMPSFLHDHTR